MSNDNPNGLKAHDTDATTDEIYSPDLPTADCRQVAGELLLVEGAEVADGAEWISADPADAVALGDWR